MALLEHTKKDGRYEINLEWCGYPQQRHVVRFCGSWVGQARSVEQAWLLANRHNANRIGVEIN